MKHPMIKKLIITIAGLASSVASAYSEPSVCYESTYDGFYVGGNLGVITQYAFRDEESDLTTLSGKSYGETDCTAGVQLGYDFNCGGSLLGLIFDWNWSNVEQRHTSLQNDDNLKDELKWFLTIRGRAGFSVCDCLLYLTGGAALARFESNWDIFVFGETRPLQNVTSRWGWTGGVGGEYLIGCHLSLGAELLFMQFNYDTKSFSITGPVTTADLKLGTSDSVWVGRVMLNYRFGAFCK